MGERSGRGRERELGGRGKAREEGSGGRGGIFREHGKKWKE